MAALDMQKNEPQIESHSTAGKYRTNLCITKHLGKFSLKGTHQNLLQTEPGGNRYKTRGQVSLNILKKDSKTFLIKPPIS